MSTYTVLIQALKDSEKLLWRETPSYPAPRSGYEATKKTYTAYYGGFQYKLQHIIYTSINGEAERLGLGSTIEFIQVTIMRFSKWRRPKTLLNIPFFKNDTDWDLLHGCIETIATSAKKDTLEHALCDEKQMSDILKSLSM